MLPFRAHTFAGRINTPHWPHFSEKSDFQLKEATQSSQRSPQPIQSNPFEGDVRNRPRFPHGAAGSSPYPVPPQFGASRLPAAPRRSSRPLLPAVFPGSGGANPPFLTAEPRASGRAGVSVPFPPSPPTCAQDGEERSCGQQPHGGAPEGSAADYRPTSRAATAAAGKRTGWKNAAAQRAARGGTNWRGGLSLRGVASCPLAH